jgi:putative serine protease PepD
VAVLAAFAAGVGGVLVGIGIGDDADTAPVASSPGVEGDPVATVPGPVDPDTDEPIAAVAEALSPAVVQIETPNSLGSGFIYDSEGLVLTAAHVVGNADDVVVRLADGTRSEGVVLGRDPGTDVAVVEIDGGDDLPVATLATGVDLSVGQSAVAIGSPFGLDQTVTAGIVSAVGRSTAMPDGGAIPAVQTDAPINSGNSGGALADLQGRVIGINDSIFTGSAGNPGNVGIGFAIPIDIAKAVADKIVAGEPAETGFLGVRGADASAERAGALIIDVEGGSPAAAAGMGVDDVVIAVDGRPVSSMVDLVARISTAQPGDAVTLTVVRDGAERELEVTLGTAPGR